MKFKVGDLIIVKKYLQVPPTTDTVGIILNRQKVKDDFKTDNSYYINYIVYFSSKKIRNVPEYYIEKSLNFNNSN